MVYTILRRRGIQIQKNGELIRMRYDEGFFAQIDTHEKAYWLGFIYADGSVHDNYFSIGLAIRDKEHLSALKQSIQAQQQVRLWKQSCVFAIGDPKLVSQLNQLGVMPRKSLILRFPSLAQVPETYLSSFMLGYFDGDGSIQSYHPRNCANPKWLFGIIGTHHFCEKFRDILAEKCGLRKVKLIKYKRIPEKDIWQLHYCGVLIENVEKVFLFLYGHSPIWLDRKRKIFKAILETGRRANYTSKFNGVHLDEWGKYIAQIAKDGNRQRVGRFADEMQAAKAYDEEARRLYGPDYPFINFKE